MKVHPNALPLKPPGITPDMLDERSVWFLWTALTSLGLPRASPHLTSKLVSSYTSQLEQSGLWDWAVFVAQHLPHAAGRSVTVQRIVQRNITLNATDTESESEEEKRCVAHHHVQQQVFHCARALHARYTHHWDRVVMWYTAAGMYDAAHLTLMQFLGVYYLWGWRGCMGYYQGLGIWVITWL